jgi:hypothetical protein
MSRAGGCNRRRQVRDNFYQLKKLQVGAPTPMYVRFPPTNLLINHQYSAQDESQRFSWPNIYNPALRRAVLTEQVQGVSSVKVEYESRPSWDLLIVC